MSMSFLRGSSEWALMVALVFGAGAIAQAQDEEPQPGGPVIQIGKADGAGPNLPAPNQGVNPQEGGGLQQPTWPKYWIGLAGGTIPADHVLRAHVNIPEGHGLLVANVVPDSPAAKAGLKQHDILLRANDSELHEMTDLVDLVLAEGEKKGQISLEVLRRGERETVYLTPEERPADAPRPQFGGGLRGEFGDGLDLFGPGGRIPREFRNFGPGVIVGGPEGMGNLPNGVTLSIQKEEGKPTRLTVKRGDETWEVVGDDPESLKQLPEDLRPFVEPMLQGGGSPFGMNFRRPGQGPMPELGDGRLQERLERMEKRMQELMERFGQERVTPNDGEQSK